MAHNHPMTAATQTPLDARAGRYGAVEVGVALVVAELLLAVLWYPWVVEHLFFRQGVSYEVLRVLIVAPEYLLLAVAVHLVALTRDRRLLGVGCALLAGLVAWGVSVLASHLAPTPEELSRHRELLTTLSRAGLVLVPTLGTLAWGVARRQGRLWLLAVPLAPALHYGIQHSHWPQSLQSHVTFRAAEAIGMTLAILPVLLAVVACWAVEQVDLARPATPEGPAYDEGPPPQG
jgi:hypothetical protein